MSPDLSRWTPPDQGALFIVTGPSGTGKTTLVRRALADVPAVGFSVSATTRAPRSGEVDGRDYHFLTLEAFQAAVESGQMLEWAEVYGRCYGTPAAPVDAALAAGESIILDIDAQGAAQVRTARPEAVSIFVLPPNVAALEARLRSRSTDTDDTIRRRMREAEVQLRRCAEFDYLVVNDDLETAHRVFQSVLISELTRRARRPSLVARFGESPRYIPLQTPEN